MNFHLLSSLLVILWKYFLRWLWLGLFLYLFVFVVNERPIVSSLSFFVSQWAVNNRSIQHPPFTTLSPSPSPTLGIDIDNLYVSTTHYTTQPNANQHREKPK